MKYFFHPSARAEHLEHVAYYEEQLPGLGARYIEAFKSLMARICENPSRYKLEKLQDIRRGRIAGFPFYVLFLSRGDGIEILAIAHYRRRPAYWVKRQ